MSERQSHPSPEELTVAEVKQAFLHNLLYNQGKNLAYATPTDCYLALAYTVREHLMERWLATTLAYLSSDVKVVYYLSAEYLLGRQLTNALLNTDAVATVRQALSELGLDLDALAELEVEPGLGNGGLGRLAACFLDSLATLSIPAVGYGIRYEYGIFRQTFEEGWQVEQADDWLRIGNPWEFASPDQAVEVGFGGTTETVADGQGRSRGRWTPATTVLGIPYNYMVPGYRSGTVNTLRLWSARATAGFDLQVFNTGDYVRAVERNIMSENISKVLYPDDTTLQGKRLRLQQQYFFVACSLRDIIGRYLVQHGDLLRLPELRTLQLNDTHPTVAIPELMRLLVDEHGIAWDAAWSITRRCFAYTVHTLLPEALEEWPISLLGELLPRHLEIIYAINDWFLAEVERQFPGDDARRQRMSIIREEPERRVRMAYLAVVGSHAVNGVAELHSSLVRERLFVDFAEMWPSHFGNRTNGVTPRRFLRLANPRLYDLITTRLGGDDWLRDLERLRELEPLADDATFRGAWHQIKQQNKLALVAHVQRELDLAVDVTSLFDVMIKRLHEYKRQLLKVFHVIALHQRLRAGSSVGLPARTVIFGAKAAPGYVMAKLIIKLINSVAAAVNADPLTRDRLRVVYVPNYNVSRAEWIVPAADLSEQISLAGYEASGTGNMKLALNGALTVGTLDGANIEILERVGAENFYLFGLTTEQVQASKSAGYRPQEVVAGNPVLRQVIDQIAAGVYSGGDREVFRPIVDDILTTDRYMVCADFQAYLDAQALIERDFQDVEQWTRRSILNCARCGFFSSDRTIRQYASETWAITPLTIPG